MSKQVDERVVSMQFDNKHFESNVQTSLSTLDKLKQKLNFKGATKGLENVNAAAKKVDMNGLGAAIGSVGSRFSAMEVIGVTALANITNQAVNAGKRIASALTIDPVKTGFQEYETQINAVQTILANTESKGTVIDDVNRALEELNKYADMTIYNFTEMTRNIGTFTAAGVDLDTSVNAIKGIANLAAVSGSTSQQASTAMYQLSQALSSGTVKLMDWNSVVNAGMGGQVFQDALKETARVHGVAIDKMIEEQGSFRETLSEGWLTSEILTDTLQKFTLATEGLSEEQIEANRQMLKAKGYTDDQIEAIFKLGNTATNAATKVKTFTQLWDVLKEAAQSGWSQTWKLIVGDFEEAKALLTPLADFLTGVINKTSEWRNKLLEGALSFNPWQALMKKLESSGLMSIKKYVDGVSDVAKTLEYYQNAITAVWRGDYKNSDTGRYGLLDAAGYDHRVIQDLVNLSDTYFKGQGYKYQLTIEDVQNSQKKFGVAVSESTDQVADMSVVLANLTDEQLKNAGLTDEEIKLFRELAEEAKRTGKPLNQLIEEMSKVDGRTLLIESFKNAGSGLVSVITAIKDAWVEVFPPMTSIQLYNIIKGLNDFSKHLIVGDDTADKLKRTLKGVFAIVHILTTILGGGFKIAFKFVTQLLGMFNLDILDVTAAIGDALVAFDKWIDSALDFTGIFKKMMPYITTFGGWIKKTFGKVKNYFQPAIDAVKNWFNSLKTSDNLAYDIVTGLARGIVNGTKFIAKAIQTLGSKGWSGLKALFSGKEGQGIGNDIVLGLVKGIKDGAKIIWDAMIELGKTLLEKFKGVLGIHSPSRAFMTIGGFIISGLLIGLTAGFPEVWNTLKGFGQSCLDALSNIDWGALFALASIFGTLFVTNKLANALQNFSEPFSEFGEALERVSKGAKNWLNAKAMKEMAISLAILAGAIVVLTLVDTNKMWHAVGAIAVLAVVMGALFGLIAWVGKKGSVVSDVKDLKQIFKFSEIALLLVALSASIAIIAGAMKSLSGVDEDAMKKAGMAIGYIALIIAALIAATRFAGPNIDGVGSMFLKLSAALLILAILTKIVGKMQPDALQNGTKAIIAFGAIVIGLMAATRLIGDSKNVEKIGEAIYGVSKAIALLALVAIVLSWVNPENLQTGVKAILAFGVMIVVLMAATKLISGSRNVDKIGGAILGVSKAIALLALVAIVLSYVKPERLESGIKAILAFGVIILALMAAVKLIGGAKNAADLGKSILYVAAAIGVLGLVATLLGLVSENVLKRGITCVAAFATMVGLLVLVSKNAKNAKFAYLIVLTTAIVAMAGVVVALSFLDQNKMSGAVIALSTLMIVFALLAKATNSLKAGKGWGKVAITLGILTGIIAVLGLLLWLLGDINPENSIGNAMALSVLLGVLTGVCYLILGMTKTFKANKTTTKAIYTILATLGALTLVVAAIGAVIYMMQGVPFKQAIGSVVALSLMLGALVVAVEILSKFKVNFTNAALGAAALLLMAIPLIAFVGVLAAMQGVENALPNVLALTVLTTALTLLLIPLSIVGGMAMSGTTFVGIAALLLMAIPLIAFVGILAAMQGIQNAEQNVNLLNRLLVVLTGVMVVLSVIGPLALVGAVAMAAMTLVVAAIGAFIIAVGAIFQKFPQLESFIDTGIPILEKIAYGLGSIVGHLIAGFSEAVMTSLPAIGLCLSEFFVNATPFIEGMKLVDSDVLVGVGILAASILALVVADVINGISAFLSGGESFSRLGTELSKFAINALPFFTIVSSIKPEVMHGVKSLADTIMTLTASNILEGLTSWFTGGTSFEKFGNDLASLGSGVKSFADSVSDLDQTTLERTDIAATIIKKLSEAAQAIPKTGGFWQSLFGENSLAGFATGIKDVGSALRTFVSDEGVGSKFGQAQVDIIDFACQAIQNLAESAEAIPKTEGFWQSMFGNNSLSKFGDEIKEVGVALRTFVGSDGVGTFGQEQVNTVDFACQAINKFADAAEAIGNNTGFWDKLFGGNLKDLANQLQPVGQGLKTFSDALNGVSVTNISAGANSIKTLAEAVSVLPEDSARLSNFANHLPTVSHQISKYYKTLAEVTPIEQVLAESKVQTVLESCAKLDDERLISAASKIENLVFAFTEMKRVTPAITSGFFDALNGLGDLSIDAIAEALDVKNFDVHEVGIQLVDTLCSGIAASIHHITDLSIDAMEAFVNGASEQSTVAKEQFAVIALYCCSALSESITSFFNAGFSVVSGFASGIGFYTYIATSAARSMAKAAADAAEEELDINSPSKVFRAIGYSVPEGFSAGIDALSGMVNRSSVKMADTAVDGVKSSIARIADIITSDVDTQPTIRPVFDLSDIRSGAMELDNMLGGRTLSVNAGAVGSVAASMANRQNGNNSIELLSAIKGLRKDVANNPRNSYNFNGISFQEGSDVAVAMEALVRAIKLEGRT
mgnify:CR=1 FL=1